MQFGEGEGEAGTVRVCLYGFGCGVRGYFLVFDGPSVHPRSLLNSLGNVFLSVFGFFSFVGSISPHLSTMYTSSPSSRHKRHGALLLRYVLLPRHDISRLEAVLGRPIQARHDDVALLDGGAGDERGGVGEPALAGLGGSLDDELVDEDNDDDDDNDEDWRVLVN